MHRLKRMIQFKNRNTSGFTLTEVLMSIVVIGIALVPIFGLQQTSYTAVARTSRRVNNFFAMHEFLYDTKIVAINENKETLSETKKVDVPLTTLLVDVKPADDPSLKDIKGIIQEQVVAQWKENQKPRREVLISATYKAPKKAIKEKEVA